MNRFALLCTAAFLSVCAPSFAAEDYVTLDRGKAFVAPDNKVQRFTQNINLAKGQDKLDLKLTYYNGTATAPGFKWLRINSSTMSYLTEAQFAGKKELTVDVTGELGPGGNQLLIEAGGVQGSTFDWQLTTEAPLVLSVVPETPQAGGTITVTGKNFSSDPTADVATVGGQALQCIHSSPTNLVFKIPEEFNAGAGSLKLEVGGLGTGESKLSIAAGSPILKGVSVPWVAPGYNFEIYGGPFSPTAAGNKVTVGPFDAEVVHAGIQTLTVQAPVGFAGNPWGVHQPIRVWSNGARARNILTINCYSGISF
jgi:hypothetical protein